MATQAQAVERWCGWCKGWEGRETLVEDGEIREGKPRNYGGICKRHAQMMMDESRERQRVKAQAG